MWKMCVLLICLEDSAGAVNHRTRYQSALYQAQNEDTLASTDHSTCLASAPRGGGGDAHTKKSMASQELSTVEVALAGSMARVVAQSVLHPLDVVRTRTQAKSIGSGGRSVSVLSFGLAPQMLLSGPAGALQFTATDTCRSQLEILAPGLSPAFIQLISAAIGTALAASVRVPQEVLKQGCMAELYPNAYHALVTIWSGGGLGGFYRGARETLVRDVLWNSLSFAFFRILAERDGPDSSARRQYMHGIIAGSTAALLTHPLDVLKTRVMTSSADVDATTSIFFRLVALVKAEGPLILFKGIVPRLLYLGPLASLVLATNEVIAAWILASKNHHTLRYADARAPSHTARL